MADEKDDLKFVEQCYKGEADRLEKARADAATEFDKWLLTVTGGAFGITMTFAKDIASAHSTAVRIWLALAWFCFLMTILFIMINKHLSYRGMLVSLEILRDTLKEYMKNGCTNWAQYLSEARAKQSKAANIEWIECLNKMSLGTFALGILFVIASVCFSSWKV